MQGAHNYERNRFLQELFAPTVFTKNQSPDLFNHKSMAGTERQSGFGPAAHLGIFV